LFDVSVERAREAGLLDQTTADKTALATCDSTGMEAGQVSHYFTRRSGKKQRKFPKFWAVVQAASHVCLAMVPGKGPSPDDPQFHRVAREAHAREAFLALAADIGFDGEEHQRFLQEELDVIGIIPPQRGRPRHSEKNKRSGFYRSFMHQHWPGKLYGQRWQIETFFSMLKRLLDSFLRAMNWRSQHREMSLKVLTLNFMLIAGKG
jgi:transposase